MAEHLNESRLVWNLVILGAVLIAVKNRKFLSFYGYFILYYAVNAILMASLLPIFLLNPFSVKNSLIGANTLKHTTRLLGIRWELRGADVVPVDEAAVVVANHQSALDFLGMSCIWHALGRCVATAKLDLFYYLLPFSLVAWLSGAKFLDRRNPTAAMKELDQVMRLQKTKMWVFAEGTRNKKGKTLLPFKKGAFRNAITYQVPVLPVVFSPYYFIDGQQYELSAGKMVVQVLPPIPTTGLTMDDLDDLVERTRHIMQTTFDALSAEMAVDQKNPSNAQEHR